MMRPIDHLDMSAEELAERVKGPVWERWVSAEAGLGRLSKLAELRDLRGAEADQLLGALVRLAAKDGGDDELAARAVAHQLAGEALGVAIELRDLGPDVDHVVITSLWLEIRTFPWQRRTRAFATSLRHATRRSALEYFLDPPRDRKRLVVRPPEDIAEGAITPISEPSEGGTAAESRSELVEYLEWCVRGDWITTDDATLMLELVAAGWQTLDRGVLKLKRGVCSMHAVAVVAGRRGVCIKTVVRERDRVLALLREARTEYFLEVA
jgi:hypothetical protein